MSSEETEAKILEFIKDDLRVSTEGLDRNTELVSTGIIDSADLVRFATFLERTFGIEVADQDISAECFNTIAMSVDYVRAHQAG